MVSPSVSYYCPMCKSTKNFNFLLQTTKYTPKQTAAFKASNQYLNCIAVDIDIEAKKKSK